MAHWLFKSEPVTWSWAQQLSKGAPEEWHGIRNYAARNNMRLMKLGDEGFFYHSVQEKQVMGIVRVVRLAHPDSTADNPTWECVDIEAVKPLPRPVTLEQIKAEPRLAGMVLINNSRLSVQPVTDAEWDIVCQMGGL